VTKKFLHSHSHVSPLSHHQEVSAFGHSERQESDVGDNWIVECIDHPSDVLKHVNTQRYLFADGNHRFGPPISGQLEISAVAPSVFRGRDRGEQWVVKVKVHDR
jgi:dolichyl-phosphate-mannose--protein O-mannosyl transferase